MELAEMPSKNVCFDVQFWLFKHVGEAQFHTWKVWVVPSRYPYLGVAGEQALKLLLGNDEAASSL